MMFWLLKTKMEHKDKPLMKIRMWSPVPSTGMTLNNSPDSDDMRWRTIYQHKINPRWHTRL